MSLTTPTTSIGCRRREFSSGDALSGKVAAAKRFVHDDNEWRTGPILRCELTAVHEPGADRREIPVAHVDHRGARWILSRRHGPPGNSETVALAVAAERRVLNGRRRHDAWQRADLLNNLFVDA